MGWPEISRIVLRALGGLIAARAAFDLVTQLYTLAAYDFIGRQAGPSQGAHAGLIALYFMPSMAFLGLGLLLILVTPRLVRRFGRAEPSEQTEINIRAIENVFVAVLGLYFLADGLAEFARVVFSLAFHAYGPSGAFASIRDILADLCRIAAKVVIALGLLLRTDGACALIHRFAGGVRRLRDWPT